LDQSAQIERVFDKGKRMLRIFHPIVNHTSKCDFANPVDTLVIRMADFDVLN
jgi:hypothetical protein